MKNLFITRSIDLSHFKRWANFSTIERNW